MKSKVNYTIEQEVVDRLEAYVKERLKILGSKKSRSSIVEEALSEHLVKLNRELNELKSKSLRDASVAR